MKKINLLISSFFVFILFINVSAQEKAVPVFRDGEAQVVEAFEESNNWIRHDLWVETGFDTDGNGKPDRMHVAVTRPLQTETEGLKLPVVYVSSPYFAGVAGGGLEYFWDIYQEVGAVPPERKHPPEIKAYGERPIISNSHINTWVPRGYIVVHSSSPGTGMSDGSPTVGGPNETLAPKAVIDWLCGRAKGYTEREGGDEVEAFWCTGKVGMTGTSYNGTLPVAAATTGVEGLEAIIPIAPNTSYYHYYRSNGLVVYPGGWQGEDIDVLFDFIHSGKEEYREYARKTIRDGEMAEGQDRITGDLNDFWEGRDYLNQMDDWKAALLMSHGFNDWNVQAEHSYRIYNKVREMGIPCQIYYHQGGHGGPPPVSMMNKWFTRYLHGVENGVEDDPKAWIVREDDQMSEPTPYEDYPNPETELVALFPFPGAPGAGSLKLENSSTETTETLTDNYSFSGDMLAQAEITDHRLLYLSPVLKEDLHISGVPEIFIKVASSKPAANLSVWLVSLPWTEGRRSKITDNLINRTWADIQNYESLYESEPLEPGKFYSLKFNFQPDDQVIKAGQQIGLMIMGSDKDFTLRPEPGTELTIDLDGTMLRLPIVGGAEAYQKAIEK
ncbi:MAG: Xaa-Pro dipeptidyl-peptidase [Bacteroidales bacterium]|jgi:X-Pro dipeptidyl-peptidase|nr:Xaa-Pro dipeptidyl-peptidase [Bacteroidales bacterium]